MRRLLVCALAGLVLAAAATAAAPVRPPQSTLGSTTFTVTATFQGLTPFQRYDATFTAHFADGDIYVLGVGWGKTPGSSGVLAIWTDVADLVYFNPGEPLEWVRFCLRPPGTSALTEITGPDGLPLCLNVETGGYHSGEYDDDGYGAETLNLQVSRMVAAMKATSARRTS